MRLELDEGERMSGSRISGKEKAGWIMSPRMERDVPLGQISL